MLKLILFTVQQLLSLLAEAVPLGNLSCNWDNLLVWVQRLSLLVLTILMLSLTGFEITIPIFKRAVETEDLLFKKFVFMCWCLFVYFYLNPLACVQGCLQIFISSKQAGHLKMLWSALAR